MWVTMSWFSHFSWPTWSIPLPLEPENGGQSGGLQRRRIPGDLCFGCLILHFMVLHVYIYICIYICIYIYVCACIHYIYITYICQHTQLDTVACRMHRQLCLDQPGIWASLAHSLYGFPALPVAWGRLGFESGWACCAWNAAGTTWWCEKQNMSGIWEGLSRLSHTLW
jgi:hypothetical protein